VFLLILKRSVFVDILKYSVFLLILLIPKHSSVFMLLILLILEDASSR